MADGRWPMADAGRWRLDPVELSPRGPGRWLVIGHRPFVIGHRPSSLVRLCNPPAAGIGSLDPGGARPLQSPLVGRRGRRTTPLVPHPRSNRRMSRRFVNQLSNGDAVDESFLVADKQL